MSAMTICLMLTFGCSCAVADRNWPSVWRWNSSVKTWKAASVSARMHRVSEAHLNHHLHQILLRDDVFAAHDLLQDARQDVTLVHVEIHAVQLAQADKVGADKNPEVLAFHLALLPVARMALVLQTHPELVHFNKVGQHKRYGVLEVALRSRILQQQSQ